MNTRNKAIIGNLSDKQIIDEIRNGNIEMYRILIKKYNQRLYRTALSFNISNDDCDDILQQTYIRAFEKLHQFQGEALFSTWLTKILINECLMLKRKEKNELGRKENLKLVTSSNALHQTPEYNFMQNELKIILEKEINILPEKYRQVFLLREVEGMSVKETSQLLGVTETNIKIRLHRAKSLLKESLSKKINYKEAFTIGNERCDNIADRVMEKISR
jgi:RNA polymerase sigma factor (sigma-70 family)